MLSSYVTPQCVVPRAVWGQFLPMPAATKGGLSVVNGQNQQQMQLVPQGQSAIHHELRMWSEDSYLMYCVFCGELGAQMEWTQLLRGLGKHEREQSQ